MADPEKNPAVVTPVAVRPGIVPKVSTGGKQLQAPPGYKILKVRMPDGTIAKIKRKIDDAPAATDTKATVASPAATKKASTEVPSIPTSNSVPLKGETKPISEKSPTATVVQPAKPSPDPAKLSTPVETTHSTKESTTRKAPSNQASWTKHRSRSGRFFTTFATRAAAALIPDLGEFHTGDEVLPSDSDDSDGYDEDDDNNNHDQDNYDGHRNSSSMDQQPTDGQQQQHHIGNNLAIAGTKGLAAGIGAPPPAYKGNGEKTLPRVNEKDIGVVDAATATNAAKPGEDGARAMSLHSSFSDWTKYIIWGIMISFPVLFIVLGILASSLPHGPSSGKYAVGVTNSIKVAISTWPIVFAAIAAQTLRSIANYRVERGIQMMTLEQLMGSNSVASSIKQPFLLRRFNLVTIALLLLWSLSPLATQALQRMSYLAEKDVTQYNNASYLDTWTYNTAFSQYDDAQNRMPNSGSLIQKFTVAGTLPPGPAQQLYNDQYNFPRIPIIELLNTTIDDYYNYGFDATPDTHLTKDNHTLSEAYSAEYYSSNYGIPLQLPGLKDSDILNFIISSTYLSFSCSNFTQVFGSAKTTAVELYPANKDIDQTTFLGILPIDDKNHGQLFYYRYLRSEYDGLLPADNDIFAYSMCNFSQIFVDSEISCEGSAFSNTDDSDDSDSNKNATVTNCIVAGIRNTSAKQPPTQMSDFAHPFMEAVGSIIDEYLQDPNGGSLNEIDGTNIMNVSRENFTISLSLLVNTYWQLGFGPAVQEGSLDINSTHQEYNYTVRMVPAVILSTTSIYDIDIIWLTTLFICSVILLFAGIANIILDTRTVVPDMLGFAASLARKSRYVDLPPTNTSMSGPERARRLAKERVMMQDVRPKAAVGRVALGYARKDAKRLEKGRLYR